MARILPIHPDTVSHKWSKETLKIQAEKHCKPFFVIVHRCLDIKIRSDEQIEACKIAPKYLDMCVDQVLSEMEKIAEMKSKGLLK